MNYTVQSTLSKEIHVSSKKADDIQPLLESDDTDACELLDFIGERNIDKLLSDACNILRWVYNQMNHEKISIPNKHKSDVHNLIYELEKWNNISSTTLQES